MDDIFNDALAIQDRCVAEPMLKSTGRGALKNRGADGLQRDAEELRQKFGHASGTKRSVAGADFLSGRDHA